MAEYIEREALIENVKRVYCTDCNSYNGVRCRACGTGDALEVIESAPSADVVEVVRCKDCKRWARRGMHDTLGYCHTNDNENSPFHTEQDPITNEMEFCCWGERKEQT